MDRPELTVLDVGRGSCNLIVDGEMAFVIDTPQGNRMLNLALADKGISHLDAVLISHGDADHVGGVMSLLANSSVEIDQVYLNPEMDRETDVWEDLQKALKDARKRGKVRLRTELTMSTEEDVQLPRLRVEILAPAPENAMTGAGGRSAEGRRMTSNSMSVVLRLSDDDCRGVLLTGDIDGVGIDEALDEGRDLEADVLVFPHHGGRPGRSDPEAFARVLTEQVRPETVIFSLSREQEKLPNSKIIEGVRAAGGQSHIACTQLSKQCCATAPSVDQPYLSTLPSRGKANGHCCAGTVEIFFTESGVHSPQLDGHGEFVSGLPEALCQAAS